MQLTMEQIHKDYMDGYLAHVNGYSMSQYKALEIIDQVLNETVGKVSYGRIYKKMSQRISGEIELFEGE